MSATASATTFSPTRRTHDLWLLLSAALLILTGLLSVSSISFQAFGARQLIFAALGIGVFYVFNRIRLDTWRALATPLYLINLGLLIAVLFFGKSRGITSRWIEIGPMQFQPSEVSKLILAITIAAFFANREDHAREWKTLLGAMAHVAPPLALVFLQPHLGATLAILFMALVACVQAGAQWKHIGVTLLALALLATAAWLTPGVFSQYQRERVYAKVAEFRGEGKDIRGSGYQQHQATLAIANGGAFGAGFFRGEQKATGAIPEQQNDFIFSVIGEEGGFFGSILVLALYAFFFYRVWLRVYLAETLMGQVVAASLFAVLAFHTIVNLAMVLSVGPVVGLWLPFASYGGTALWMCMGALGLLDQCK